MHVPFFPRRRNVRSRAPASVSPPMKAAASSYRAVGPLSGTGITRRGAASALRKMATSTNLLARLVTSLSVGGDTSTGAAAPSGTSGDQLWWNERIPLEEYQKMPLERQKAYDSWARFKYPTEAKFAPSEALPKGGLSLSEMARPKTPPASSTSRSVPPQMPTTGRQPSSSALPAEAQHPSPEGLSSAQRKKLMATGRAVGVAAIAMYLAWLAARKAQERERERQERERQERERSEQEWRRWQEQEWRRQQAQLGR